VHLEEEEQRDVGARGHVVEDELRKLEVARVGRDVERRRGRARGGKERKKDVEGSLCVAELRRAAGARAVDVELRGREG